MTTVSPSPDSVTTGRRRGRLALVALGVLVLLATTCTVDPASGPSVRSQPDAGASLSAEGTVAGSDEAGDDGANAESEPGSGAGGDDANTAGGGDGGDNAAGSPDGAGSGDGGGTDGGDGTTTGTGPGGGTTASGGGSDGNGDMSGTSGGAPGDSDNPGAENSDTPAPPAAPPGPRFPEPLGLTLTRIAELPVPLALAVRAQEPGSLYVALRHGVVVRLRGDGGRADSSATLHRDGDAVLDMSARVDTRGEMGLLGLTFSPAGDRLYTSSVNRQQVSELWEWPVAADGSVADGRGRLVLSLAQPFWNHNGGDVTHGPDGHLYLGFGDGGGAGDPLRAGQDPHDWLGTILRIDPRPGPAGEPYTIPAGNPYADGAAGAPEVWVWGARNPWRFSFDRTSGDLWVADVGQDLLEEINRLPAAGGGAGRGANLGWSDYEGSAPFWSNTEPRGHVRPVVEYRHGESERCSVTGGYVYRGAQLPGLTGVYLYSDFCDGTLWGYSDTAGAHPIPLAVGGPPRSVLSFGRGPDGEIYVLTPEALWRFEEA